MPPSIPASLNEVYVVCDVDADGPIPGPHSMLRLGAAAFLADGTLLGTFVANLEELEGAAPDPAMARYWRAHPQAWEACRRHPEPPPEAMARFVTWLDELPGKPVFVAYPGAYDFLFVYWYLMRFAGHSPFGHSALDIKTYAMAMLGTGYHETTKRKMPRRWLRTTCGDEDALGDAVCEGTLFVAMLRENRARGGLVRPAPRPAPSARTRGHSKK